MRIKNTECSDKDNTEKPMSAGFFRLEKGTPLVHQYIYDEMKLVTEGEFEISDETGQKVKAKPGDVFYFPHGTKATYTTESYGVGFYVCSLFSLIYRVVADRKRLFNGRARYNKQL